MRFFYVTGIDDESARPPMARSSMVKLSATRLVLARAGHFYSLVLYQLHMIKHLGNANTSKPGSKCLVIRNNGHSATSLFLSRSLCRPRKHPTSCLLPRSLRPHTFAITGTRQSAQFVPQFNIRKPREVFRQKKRLQFNLHLVFIVKSQRQ